MHSIFGDAAAAPHLVVLADAVRRAREAVVAGIRAGGGRAVGARADVADPAAVRRLFDAAESGGLDPLGDNGGLVMPKPIAEGDALQWRGLPVVLRVGETSWFWVNGPGRRARERRDGPTAPASSPRREAPVSSIVVVIGASSGLAALLAGALFLGVFDGGLPKPARAGAAAPAPSLRFHGPGGELLGFTLPGSAALGGPRAAEADGGSTRVRGQ
jgi:hypothetical protein